MVNFVLGFADDEGRSFLWYEPSRELTHPPELHGEVLDTGGRGGGREDVRYLVHAEHIVLCHCILELFG